MRILLVNPPHPAIGSRIPDEHLPPLGLLSIGGPLLDAGHDVELLDADIDDLSVGAIVACATRCAPEAVLVGHSGSTSGHPIACEVTRAIRSVLPQAHLIYGGVFPTYHWREVLDEEPQVDIVVRGEGDQTIVQLIGALARSASLDTVRGIAFRRGGRAVATAAAPVIRELDSIRVGWELVDLRRYSYWGGKRAVVVQLSRGCPHSCSYCGQRGFWTQWRYRDPKKLAAEIAWLHREHGVEVFNLADENPTASRRVWREFLEALIAEDVRVTLVGSTRADDIVRDSDLLHLYKRAGVARFLLGMESTDEATLRLIEKGGATAKDRQAIRLLRQHGIISLATWVVGFEEETSADYLRGLRQLISYDPDQIQLLYATPHRWTPYFRLAAHRRVIQQDPRCWDYKHQVLQTRHLKPWQVLALVKLMEAVLQLRPRALGRLLLHPDAAFRDAMRWYYRVGRRVWPHEVLSFALRERRVTDGPTLAGLWGAPQDDQERSMSVGPEHPSPAGASAFHFTTARPRSVPRVAGALDGC